MPIWAAILVGLGGGVAGTLLSVYNQRGGEFRTRMLDAAAAYLEAIEALRRAMREPAFDDFGRSYQYARDRWAELIPRKLMVELLYGRESPTATLAGTVGGCYTAILTLLGERALATDEGRAQMNLLGEDAARYIVLFSKAAADHVRAVGIPRWFRRKNTLKSYLRLHRANALSSEDRKVAKGAAAVFKRGERPWVEAETQDESLDPLLISSPRLVEIRLGEPHVLGIDAHDESLIDVAVGLEPRPDPEWADAFRNGPANTIWPMTLSPPALYGSTIVFRAKDHEVVSHLEAIHLCVHATNVYYERQMAVLLSLRRAQFEEETPDAQQRILEVQRRLTESASAETGER